MSNILGTMCDLVVTVDSEWCDDAHFQTDRAQKRQQLFFMSQRCRWWGEWSS